MILYQLGMLLLGYIAVAAAITFLVVKVTSWIAVSPKTKWVWCGLSVAFFVLLPIWDIPVAWRQFKHLCETEAGVKIIRSVDGVEGFTRLHFGSAAAKEALSLYGYQFVETVNLSNQLVRYRLDQQGTLIEERIEKPSARYRVEGGDWIPLKYAYKFKVEIMDSQTNEILATKTEFGFRGGWLGKRLHWSYPDIGNCRGEDMNYKEFFTKTLPPINRS